MAIFRERGDARRLATMLHRLGQVVHRRGDAAAAVGYHEEALALARAAGDDYTVAFALVGLGNVALAQGSRADAPGATTPRPWRCAGGWGTPGAWPTP